MSKIRIDIDVIGKDIADDIGDKIEKGIKDSRGDVSDRNGLAGQMKKAAQHTIDVEGAIWRGDLRSSFNASLTQTSGSWWLVFENTSDHAGPIEYGAEYDAEGPPIAALMPWVMSHLGAFSGFADDDGDGGGPAGGSEPESVYTVDLSTSSVDRVQSGRDYGFDRSANSDGVFVIHHDDGSKSIFKTADIGHTGSDWTAFPNEKAFSDIANRTGWTVGPESSFVEMKVGGQNVRGSIQAFVPDSEPLKERLAAVGNPDGDIDPIDFLEDHEDRFAKITLMDMLVGNRDRHSANLRIDSDGQIHAIDNGGHWFRKDNLIGHDQILAMDELTQPDFDDYVDRVEAFFEYRRGLIDDLVENSDEIVATLEDVHGPDHWLAENAEEMLDNNAAVLRERLNDLEQQWMDAHFGLGSIPEVGDSDSISEHEWSGVTLPAGLDDILDDV